MALRMRHLWAFCAAFSLGGPVFANEPEAYETMLRKALHTIKDGQQEKLRSTLTSLTSQVEGDVEPERRLQASILLAAHYWESNYRLSRYYLGIAEALKDPTRADASDAEIQHMKIRFRHAALLDKETKKEIQEQLQKEPAEPIRLSLVEMLLDTDQALGEDSDFLDIYRRYYSRYPRTVRKDRFVKKAAQVYLVRKDQDAYIKTMESLLDQYPITAEATWALDELIALALKPGANRYSFSYPMLKKVYRNSSHDPAEQRKILSLVSTPLRKTSSAVPQILSITEKVQLHCYLGLLDDALKIAQEGAAAKETPAADRPVLEAWTAYILSEKGSHADALQIFAKVPGPTRADILFQEAQAKSQMNTQKYSDAALSYLSLLKRSNHYRYRWYYFWNLLASGDIKSAARFMAASKDKTFNERDFRREASVYWEARTLLGEGRIDAAVEMMKPLLARETPNFYTLSARAAITHAQAVASKKAEGKGETPPESAALQRPLFVAFSAKKLPDPPESRSDRIPFAAYVHEISKEMNIDPYLILSIMRSESNFKGNALSQAGAQGLMQLMPYTAVRLAKLFEDKDFELEKMRSQDTNITYGSLYLSLLLHYYGGHEIPAVAAYNAGPQVVNKWLKECQSCPNDAFVEFIPYAETRNYVKKVMSTYTAFRLQETQSTPDFMQKKLPTSFPDTTNIF